jgi:hypothetical protein
MKVLMPLSWLSHLDDVRCERMSVEREDAKMCSLIRKKGVAGLPTHLGRALASVKAAAARSPRPARTIRRSGLPQMVAPEREWELLRAVEHAAREYRRAQQALAHHEEQGSEETEFRKLLDALTLRHHELDKALMEIRRYYDVAGVAPS